MKQKTFFRETTVWPGGGTNHTYLLNDNQTKMIAYIKHGTSEIFTFKKPLPFYTKGRTFVAVKI